MRKEFYPYDSLKFISLLEKEKNKNSLTKNEKLESYSIVDHHFENDYYRSTFEYINS